MEYKEEATKNKRKDVMGSKSSYTREFPPRGQAQRMKQNGVTTHNMVQLKNKVEIRFAPDKSPSQGQPTKRFQDDKLG